MPDEKRIEIQNKNVIRKEKGDPFPRQRIKHFCRNGMTVEARAQRVLKEPLEKAAHVMGEVGWESCRRKIKKGGRFSNRTAAMKQ